jgi:cell wall-associated NlpC family hydrolase
MDVAAVLARSRALAALAARRGGWDLTSDDPLYLGVDGERPAATAAALRTRGEALESAGAPVDGIVPIVRAPGDAFLPDPGRPQPVAAAPARPIAGAPPGLGPRAVALARTRLGTPYRWGGAAPGGFDCSGLVYWIYRTLGVTLPRVAEDQGAVGVPVAMGDLRPGDVVFFADSSGYVHHEGIYIGGGRMIHAPQTGDVVKIERIDTGYYARQYAGARRFSPTS